MPPDVRRAKHIRYLIIERADWGDANDAADVADIAMSIATVHEEANDQRP